MKAIESYIKHINLFFMGFGIPPFSLILVISVDHAIGPLFPISIAQDGQSLFLMSVTVTVEWWITLPPSLHRSRSADILLRNLQRHLPRLDQAQLSRLSYYVRLPARDIDLAVLVSGHKCCLSTYRAIEHSWPETASLVSLRVSNPEDRGHFTYSHAFVMCLPNSAVCPWLWHANARHGPYGKTRRQWRSTLCS